MTSREDGEVVVNGEMHLRSEMIAAQDMLLGSSNSSRLDDMWRSSQRQNTVTESTALLEEKILHRTLDEIDKISLKRIQDGFNEINFTCGVLNTILVTYVFGVYPQHFWILYLVEGLVLIPAQAYLFATSQPLNNILYLLDFCWVMNVVGVLALLLFCCDGVLLGRQLSERMFVLIASGVTCGPLLGSCLVLPFVCLLFHDVGTMAGLFIHIFPPMLLYTIRWSPDELRAAWPSVFSLDYLDGISFYPTTTSSGSVAGIAMSVYGLWFVVYGCWMLTCGMRLPCKEGESNSSNGSRQYDTVFHSLMRGGLCLAVGDVVWKRPRVVSLEQLRTNQFETRDFILYMLAHAVCATGSILVLGYGCFQSQQVHGGMLAAVTIVTTHKGAQRYTYYTTVMYGSLMRKRFAKEQQDKDP